MKALGPDNLATQVLKECAEVLAPSITAVIPLTNWKKANVLPIFKKGNSNLTENYRPISLLHVICKVQERCVASPLVPHIKILCILFGMGFKKESMCDSVP